MLLLSRIVDSIESGWPRCASSQNFNQVLIKRYLQNCVIQVRLLHNIKERVIVKKLLYLSLAIDKNVIYNFNLGKLQILFIIETFKHNPYLAPLISTILFED